MKKLCLYLVAIVFVASCSNAKEISPEQRQHEIDQSKIASQEYGAAVKRAEADDPAGFLKLYEIAIDDTTYTVEYSEVAQEKLYLLLYSKTALWVKIFSKVDLTKFKAFVKGIEVSRLPAGVVSDEQFKEAIFSKLEKMKGDKKEMELVDYILGLYGRKRQ